MTDGIHLIPKKHRLFYGLLALWIGFQLVQWDGAWDRLDGDDAQYILHAQSLVMHHKYNPPNLIYLPETITTPQSVPPVWPLLLVPLIALFGVRMVVFKAAVVLLACLAGFLVRRLASAFTQNEKWGDLVAGLYAFSMTTIVFSRMVYSEWPYLVSSYAALTLASTSARSSRPLLRWCCIGLLAGTALLCRSLGVVLVGALLAALVYVAVSTKQVKQGLLRILLFLAALLFIYQATYALVKPGEKPTYAGEFFSKNIAFPEDGQATTADIAGRIPKNGLSFIRSLAPMLVGRVWHEGAVFLFPRSAAAVDVLLTVSGAFLFLFMAAGFVRQVWKGPTAIEFTVSGYLLVLSIVWFYNEPYRYLMPIGPFLILYLVGGISFFSDRFGRFSERKGRLISIVLFFLLAVNIAQAAVEIYQYRFSGRNARVRFQPVLSAVAWLKQNALPDEVVLADDPRWYALTTGRNVTAFLKSRDGDKGMRFIEQFPRSVIVFDEQRRLSALCLEPILRKYRDRFRPLGEFGPIHLYRYPATEGE